MHGGISPHLQSLEQVETSQILQILQTSLSFLMMTISSKNLMVIFRYVIRLGGFKGRQMYRKMASIVISCGAILTWRPTGKSTNQRTITGLTANTRKQGRQNRNVYPLLLQAQRQNCQSIEISI